jgi:hypothetical protein
MDLEVLILLLDYFLSDLEQMVTSLFHDVVVQDYPNQAMVSNSTQKIHKLATPILPRYPDIIINLSIYTEFCVTSVLPTFQQVKFYYG